MTCICAVTIETQLSQLKMQYMYHKQLEYIGSRYNFSQEI